MRMSNNNFGNYQQEDKSDNITSKTKPILLELINSLQGKKDKNKVLANLGKNFANTNVDLQHRLFRLKKIVIPSIVGSAFIVGIVLIIIVSSLYANTPCKTFDKSILRIGDNPDDSSH